MSKSVFDDYIPRMVYSENLRIRSRKDLVFLGKENLEFLEKFWRSRSKRMDQKAREETDRYRRENYEAEADDSLYKANDLRTMIHDALSKPSLFVKPTFRVGTRVAIFCENPDRFIVGTIARVKADTEEIGGSVKIKNVVFLIRPFFALNESLIEYAPDGLTMFTEEDYKFLKSHPRYFRLYLDYFDLSVPDRTKTERILAAAGISPNPPPDAA